MQKQRLKPKGCVVAIVVDPISPVALNLFGLQIRWYALAYVAAFLVGYWFTKRLEKQSPVVSLDKKGWDDLLAAVILGTIIGGRLGYVLFYNLAYFISNPFEIFMVWHGGMSFHGGMLGVLTAVILFARKNKKSTFGILDMVSVSAPIGLFFGRIANFINMEVMGRATDGPFGVVFTGSIDQVPRYPSPLLEAALEGILLFIIMNILWRFTKLRNNAGAISGAFAMSYAVLRIFAEFFRAPDVQIGFLTSWGLTMGQLLSGLMFIAGLVIFKFAVRKNNAVFK